MYKNRNIPGLAKKALAGDKIAKAYLNAHVIAMSKAIAFTLIVVGLGILFFATLVDLIGAI